MLNHSIKEKTPEMEFRERASYIVNKSKENPLISIVIPLYNEENTIGEIIKQLQNQNAHEIIIVDDGSTDPSIQKIIDIGTKDLTIIHHQKNLGYGTALMTGLKQAKGDIIITMDSDGQHNPEDIKNIIIPILFDKADVVIGSRYLGHCEYKVPPHIRIGEFFIKVCLLALFRQGISNNQSGYRCFKREVIKYTHKIKSVGMGFTTEFLFECAHNNLKILEVPINLNYRRHGKSYVNILEVLKAIIYCVIKYFPKQYKFKFNLQSKYINIHDS